jgi:predicted ATP-grasp superfamily ATP-dependent carboligase
MEQAAESADAAFVVAPESGHVLQSIVECLETTGTLSLNCQAAGIETASEKAALTNRLQNLGLNFPKTATFSTSDPDEEIAQTVGNMLGFPAVLKPLYGAGCGGLSILENGRQVAAAVDKLKRENAGDQFFVQELISGVPVSVSLISTGTEALPISLNLQKITLASPVGVSSYDGGAVPFEHPLKETAFSAAKRLVESFGDLRGYVGVDLVLAGNKVFLMEVNPRLTTSYFGLRKVANFNPAQAIIQAVLKNVLPKNAQCSGFSCFAKVPVNPPTPPIWQKICSLAEVAAPPFPLGTATAYALVESRGETFLEAQRKLSEAETTFQSICKGSTQLW